MCSSCTTCASCPASVWQASRCEVFSLEPHDAARYAVRLWADKGSGLLMRAQTIGEGGKVLEQVAFSQVDIGVPSDKQRILSAIKSSQSWNRYEVTYQPANVADEVRSSVPRSRVSRRFAKCAVHWASCAHPRRAASPDRSSRCYRSSTATV